MGGAMSSRTYLHSIFEILMGDVPIIDQATLCTYIHVLILMCYPLFYSKIE
jgi:hypothetical protein